jgi:hypothetical protein
MFTTNPGFISSIEVHPGMSDYIVIITDVNLKAKSAKKKPRKVFLYEKADMDGLKTFIKDKLTRFLISLYFFQFLLVLFLCGVVSALPTSD